MFRQLDKQEQMEFREAARKNYQPGTKISTTWHPVYQEECAKMNIEHYNAVLDPVFEMHKESQKLIIQMDIEIKKLNVDIDSVIEPLKSVLVRFKETKDARKPRESGINNT